MIVVGVTGGIASGKSTVARAWERRGARVLDADRVGWALLGRDDVRAALVSAFGRGILAEDDAIDRQRLARSAFADPAAAQRLNAILHPPILAEIARWIAEETARGGTHVLVVEASLIIEAGAPGLFDYLVLVTSAEPTRLGRLAAKGIAREEALARIWRQWSDDEKRPHADFVLENDESPEELERKADALWERLQALHPRRSGRREEPRGEST